ncbi:class I SAM-dependent methyltransferase [Streptomyces liangshanensis]|uniref:Class I SAM-dependent methyltransferase n=1 Tax=Streptomyces liangshanensis TaxID=2717324 RepID=A0A6G9H2U8_9ACTN|nr:class I SAM-dependent methyltransferase [Streptomyces liangshanensis]QIQ04457.1 class I SAM-dependent methyltransferase [Streptomyces liangshanensis]
MNGPSAPEAAHERAAAYWNAPGTVAEFASLTPRPYLVELLAAFTGTEADPAGGTHGAGAPGDPGLALDLGCGGGRNTRALLDHGFRVVAMDLHEAMVEATRSAVAGYPAERVTVRGGAAHAVPAESGTFAFVVCYGVLHNAVDVAQWRSCVTELARVLRPGGTLAFNCFTSDSLDPRLRPGGETGRHLLPDGVPMVLLPSEEIVDAFARAGLALAGPPHTYVRDLDVGPRAVLRCEFRKEVR